MSVSVVRDFAEVTTGIASLLRAIAWPSVVLFLAFRYRDQVGRLIDRLRKGGSAEFDPVPQPTATEPLSTAAAIGASVIASIRTQGVIETEERVSALPIVKDEPDPFKKSAVLLTLAAKAVLYLLFERAEASIFASQLELLNYLNANPTGETADRVRQLFYHPAAGRFPDLYRNYPFENYLNFLQSSGLIHTAGLRVTITAKGRDYLFWRVEQHKPPRMGG